MSCHIHTHTQTHALAHTHTNTHTYTHTHRPTDLGRECGLGLGVGVHVCEHHLHSQVAAIWTHVFNWHTDARIQVSIFKWRHSLTQTTQARVASRICLRVCVYECVCDHGLAIASCTHGPRSSGPPEAVLGRRAMLERVGRHRSRVLGIAVRRDT